MLQDYSCLATLRTEPELGAAAAAALQQRRAGGACRPYRASSIMNMVDRAWKADLQALPSREEDRRCGSGSWAQPERQAGALSSQVIYCFTKLLQLDATLT